MGDPIGHTQSRFRSILAQVGSFALAVVLLYLALRNVDLADLWARIRTASYGWLVPLTIAVFLSHIVRAYRWQILVAALPTPPRRQLRLGQLFGALMAGYMVNYAAPRLGELVRTSIASRLSGQRFAAVLGTVVAERLLDVASLGLAMLSVLFLMQDRLDVLISEIDFTSMPRILMWAVGLIVIVCGVGLYAIRRRQQSGRLSRLLSTFSDGLQTLIRSGRPVAIAVSTVVMWAFYLAMAYIPLRMLGLTTSFDLRLVDAWSLMNIGALGVVVPSPGGAGTYHYITQLALTQIWDVVPDAAAAYAILTHAIQMILYVASGFVSLVVLGIGLEALMNLPKAGAAEDPD